MFAKLGGTGVRRTWRAVLRARGVRGVSRLGVWTRLNLGSQVYVGGCVENGRGGVRVKKVTNSRWMKNLPGELGVLYYSIREFLKSREN